MTEQSASQSDGFELFEPQHHKNNTRWFPSTLVPRVRLDINGQWHISRPALESLGKPEAVTLWYDTGKERVGFKPAKTEESAAYSVRSTGRGSRQGIVIGQQFCAHYGISYAVSKVYPAQLENGMLVIDLNDYKTHKTQSPYSLSSLEE